MTVTTWLRSSRLARTCHIVNIRGNIYRMREHQNLLQASFR